MNGGAPECTGSCERHGSMGSRQEPLEGQAVAALDIRSKFAERVHTRNRWRGRPVDGSSTVTSAPG